MATFAPQTAIIQFAGLYACSGHEFGLMAAAGGLTLSANGVAIFRDYYGQEQAGIWALGSSVNELRFQGLDLISASYDAPNKLLLVVLKPGSRITHTTEDHQMECSPTVSPATTTSTTAAPRIM